MTPRAAIVGALLASTASAPAFAESCPAPLRDAHRLVLVTARNMATSAANVELFERRTTGEPWHPSGRLGAAVLGISGMAWGYPFRALAHVGEPVKIEGDKRAPAGVYRIGRSFGFAASARFGYLQLTSQTICVDDAASPAYNIVTTRATVGPNVQGEMMRRIAHYRRGLLIDYPTNASARAGSCVFIHVWRSASSGTNGCVALPEDRVAALQDFAASGAVIAILPRDAMQRVSGGGSSCLPGAAPAQ